MKKREKDAILDKDNLLCSRAAATACLIYKFALETRRGALAIYHLLFTFGWRLGLAFRFDRLDQFVFTEIIDLIIVLALVRFRIRYRFVLLHVSVNNPRKSSDMAGA
jgi:hypothetical protein